jgi:DNA-directed RNA polymerase specialized sigma24 family protein
MRLGPDPDRPSANRERASGGMRCTSRAEAIRVNPLTGQAFWSGTILEQRGERVYGMTRFVSLDPSVRSRDDVEGIATKESRLDAAHARELDRFLAGVERRAFRIAQLALRNVDDAHDAVQHAMLRLAEHYAARPSEEWRPLFFRILYNGIRDIQRRQGVRRRFFGWLPGTTAHAEEDAPDPLEQVPDAGPDPSRRRAADEALAELQRALPRLPARHSASRPVNWKLSRCAAWKASTSPRPRRRWGVPRAV